MRRGLRNRIMTIKEFEGRVYEPSAPTINTPKPYAVIVQGQDVEESGATTFARNVEVWAYTNITTFNVLDKLTSKIIDTLDLIPFVDPDGNKYTAAYLGTLGTDIIDEEWQAQTRGLSFKIISLQETEAGTQWEKAISTFLTEILGYPIYAGKWNTGFEVPSGLVRVNIDDSRPINHYLFRTDQRLNIHLINKDKDKQNSDVIKVKESLIKAGKVILEKEDDRYITVDRVTTSEGNELTQGQILVEGSRIEQIHRPGIYMGAIKGRRKINDN